MTRGGRPATTIFRPIHMLLIFSFEPSCYWCSSPRLRNLKHTFFMFNLVYSLLVGFHFCFLVGPITDLYENIIKADYRQDIKKLKTGINICMIMMGKFLNFISRQTTKLFSFNISILIIIDRSSLFKLFLLHKY